MVTDSAQRKENIKVSAQVSLPNVGKSVIFNLIAK